MLRLLPGQCDTPLIERKLRGRGTIVCEPYEYRMHNQPRGSRGASEAENLNWALARSNVFGTSNEVPLRTRRPAGNGSTRSTSSCRIFLVVSFSHIRLLLYFEKQTPSVDLLMTFLYQFLALIIVRSYDDRSDPLEYTHIIGCQCPIRR